MELKNAVKARRAKRKYTDKKVSHEQLLEIIEYARFAPMGANKQGIKYILIEDEETVGKVFGQTKWSGYEPEYAPTEAEQPPAYIAMVGDNDIKAYGSFETDAGASGTIITLLAEDMGLSSCWIGAFNKENVANIIELEDKYELLYLIAIGYSNQVSVPFDSDGDIKYFTDENGVLNVPKRRAKDIIIKTV